MKEVYKIRLHGRGGQGAKTASQFIAEAALDQGKYIQAFPEYGAERAGAPMKAFAKISDKPIKSYTAVIHPDVVMVIDPTLLAPAVVEGLTTGILIANTNKDAAFVKKQTGFKGKIHVIDATKISIDIMGRNIPNTPMLGALIKLTKIITLESLFNKMNEKFIGKYSKDIADKNIECVKRAYKEVK